MLGAEQFYRYTTEDLALCSKYTRGTTTESHSGITAKQYKRYTKQNQTLLYKDISCTLLGIN